MPAALFTYKAIDRVGASRTGQVRGMSADEVGEDLRAQGLTVTEVAEKSTGLQMEIALPQRIKPVDLAVMTRQLSTMVSSGMTLLRAFHVLESQVENKKLAEVLEQVRIDIEGGKLLSEALAEHPKVFNQLYVAMVGAGEAGGVLEESLLRVADQLEKDESLRRQVKSAMTYPTVVLVFAVIVLFAMVGFIVPVFADIFKDFGGELPAITQFTMMLSSIVTNGWWAMLLAAGGSFYAFRKWKATETGRQQWDWFRIRIPFRIGDTVKKVSLARWSRTFSSLYAAGVPIMDAIDVTGRTAGNTQVEKVMESVIESVRGGGTIAGPLRESPLFPPMISQMIAVGEETGGIDEMMSKVADFYEDEVDAAVKALTSILEPVMIVFVGGIVGFVVISMYMPMFKVYDQIQ